jgi:glycosyltransferase
LKISIVTVAYNSARTITDTLRSVAEQTHPAIEHLVIDGASSDGTLSIVRERGTRVTQLVSEPDRGIYDAMNKGLSLATGDLVGFLNADDMLAHPDAIARVARAAEETGADAVFGDLVYVGADDTERVVRTWRSGPFSRDRLRFGWMPPHPTFYVRRTRLPDVGRFDTSLRIAADYDFMLRCLARDDMNFSYVPRVLVRMRTGGASNRSLRAMWLKSTEDLRALRRSNVGGIGTLICKNLRKVPQFFSSSSAPAMSW